MSASAINWNGVELLPRQCCAVCGKITVPYGRTLDNKYLCSKQCCDKQRSK